MINFNVFLALGEIQLADVERGDFARFFQQYLAFFAGNGAKLLEKFRAAFADELVEIRVMIGEEEKRSGGCKLFALKEHRNSGAEQRERDQRPKFARTGELM